MQDKYTDIEVRVKNFPEILTKILVIVITVILDILGYWDNGIETSIKTEEEIIKE
jgi:hypothetical protein